MTRTEVVAAVVERGGRFLITRRQPGVHLEGYWEFPGGKCEPAETHDACLRRELAEELGVAARVGALVLETSHDYADRTIKLYFYRCEIDGDPSPLLKQEIKWATKAEVGALEFPPADAELIQILRRNLKDRETAEAAEVTEIQPRNGFNRDGTGVS
jgi:8-oxo-dGTP diphosphatase